MRAAARSAVVIPDRARSDPPRARRRREPGDVVVIAGKGHEDYQIVGQERRPFSDRAVVRPGASEPCRDPRSRHARGGDRRHAARRATRPSAASRVIRARSAAATCSSRCAASITTRTISSPTLLRAPASRCAGQPPVCRCTSRRWSSPEVLAGADRVRPGVARGISRAWSWASRAATARPPSRK